MQRIFVRYLISHEGMIRNKEVVIMRAIAICFKPYLKPEEAMIYCNLGRTQLSKKCEEYGVFKNGNGYFKKEDLDLILSGTESNLQRKLQKLGNPKAPGRP